MSQTVKESLGKLVKLYTEMQSVDEQIKEIKDELKEAGFNAAVIAQVAKSMVVGKTDELLDKAEEVINIVEVARS
jgi:uncharacterized protein (UPF0335 family)